VQKEENKSIRENDRKKLKKGEDFKFKVTNSNLHIVCEEMFEYKQNKSNT